MSVLIDLETGSTPKLLDVNDSETHTIDLKKVLNDQAVSDTYSLQPEFIVVPDGATFESVDLKIGINIKFAPIFRFGDDPSLRTHLPTEITWHLLSGLHTFKFKFKLAAVDTIVNNVLMFDITITTVNQGSSLRVIKSFTYNINLVK